MYSEYEGRRIHEVLLWCYQAPDDSQTIPKSGQWKHSNMHRKEDNPQIEETIDKLKEMHSGCYFLEQYNCWAHTIDMGKHNSYDSPPDLPFFVGKILNDIEKMWLSSQ